MALAGWFILDLSTPMPRVPVAVNKVNGKYFGIEVTRRILWCKKEK